MSRALRIVDRLLEAETLCARCGNPFVPKGPTERVCKTCAYKRFIDVMGLPTPPSLLDKHTEHPTLSDEEYRKKVDADPVALGLEQALREIWRKRQQKEKDDAGSS